MSIFGMFRRIFPFHKTEPEAAVFEDTEDEVYVRGADGKLVKLEVPDEETSGGETNASDA